MRARQRHFNPESVGASFVLDARFKFDQNDDSVVSSWNDRTSNNRNATQNNNSYKPKYRTNIVNGQPSIEFIPTTNNQKFLDGSITITNNVITSIFLIRLNTSSPTFARALALSKNGLNDYDSALRCIPLLKNSNSNLFYSFRSGSPTETFSISTNTWYHYTNTFNGVTNSARLNETSIRNVNSTGNFDINQFRIGFAYDANVPVGSNSVIGAWQGYISHISLYNSAISNPVRKRIQFSNALSYKISCN